MRSMQWTDTGIFILVAGLAALIFLFHVLPLRPQMWIYPLVRQATTAKVNYETRQMQVKETAHFIIKYSQTDADVVEMVAQAAEAAYEPVVEQVGNRPKGKSLILIHPDKSQLRQAFGWSGNESAMGVYWGGVIQLLSPKAWLHPQDTVEDFIHSGPLVHEFTHLVFDYKTNGNYSRWFTEGLAQYVEYKVNGYEWETATNHLTGKFYTMEELEKDFDQLSNQSLAYRQSLASIRYIAEVHGEDKLNRIIEGLEKGYSLSKMLETVLGMKAAAFEKEWQAWALQNMI